MEKVKEESRKKSEELESLRRRVQENDAISQNTSSMPHSRADSLQFQDADINAKEPVSYADDSYLMDFSKPASYQPSQPPVPEPPVIVRRRSLEPEPLPRQPSRPPVPPAPPRRSISRDHAKPAPPATPAPAAPAAPGVPKPAAKPVAKNPHSLLMEEIVQSAQQRMKKNGEL